MNKHISFAISIAAWFAAPACADPDTRTDSEVEVRTVTCPLWKCGFNAAEVNGRSLQELNLDGLPNADGARIIGYFPPPLRLGYTLDVDNDELVFRRGSSVLRGEQVIGAIVLVQFPFSLPVPVTIAGYQRVPSWAEGRPPVAAYTLTYPDPAELTGQRNVCAGTLLDPLLSVVTVLGDERYDAATKTVVPDQARWFTLACAGSAAAKMKLLGYGPQSSATTPAQRQATLKMITADYCGDGRSYTENGTQVFWANRDGSVAPPAGALGGVEAVWGEGGALCLGATRIADVEVECSLPACTNFGLEDGEWITDVPAR